MVLKNGSVLGVELRRSTDDTNMAQLRLPGCFRSGPIYKYAIGVVPSNSVSETRSIFRLAEQSVGIVSRAQAIRGVEKP